MPSASGSALNARSVGANTCILAVIAGQHGVETSLQERRLDDIELVARFGDLKDRLNGARTLAFRRTIGNRANPNECQGAANTGDQLQRTPSLEVSHGVSPMATLEWS